MLACLIQKAVVRGCFWGLFLLLGAIPGSLLAADKRLASNHLPVMLAPGAMAPLGRLPGTNQLRLALSLPLRHPGELSNLLASLYSPASPHYHHFLTPTQFADRFGPAPDDYAAILQFAKTNGLTVTATHSNRLVVDVEGPVAKVERALHVKLQTFRHPTEPRSFFAPDTEPAVDERLPLWHVSGLDNFSRPHPNSQLHSPPAVASFLKSPKGGSSPDGTFMGNDFRQAYVPGTALTGAGQNVGLIQFDAFNLEDITNYANAIGLTNFPHIVVVSVDGGVAYPGNNIGEVTLDIEMVLAMAPGVSNIFVYEAPNPSPWVDILSRLANDNSSAQASCSWSGGPTDPAAEQVLAQLAAQGQSFFVASGDFGAYTNPAEFPCASPNATEVGGTSLVTETNGDYLGESVWNSGDGHGSGGGLGFPVNIPDWQLGLDMSVNGGFVSCRTVPDVALTADNVYVLVDGVSKTATGTSCAAPLWAAFTALANEQAAQLGQPPVGLLNPALYALCRGTNYAAIFHDIASGNNTNANSPLNFPATPGFDLCTGWGTPGGTNLINALTTPDFLAILPTTDFYASGPVGGPLSLTNWTFTLTNSGVADLVWSLSDTPPWLAISAGNGTLAANGSTNISVQLVNPNRLPAASYFAVISVTNLTLSRVQNILVQADVGQSIVQNGSFETGDFTSWTLAGDTVSWHEVSNIVSGSAKYPGLVHSGHYGAFLGQRGYAAQLSQTLATVPGQQYLVSFWLDNVQDGSTQQFNAFWGGTNLASLADPSAFGWSNFLYVATATDTNVSLEFDSENDPNYFGLDDVTVMPVPPVAFTSYALVTNSFQMTWPSLAGLNYQIQYCTNLLANSWENLSCLAAVTNATTYVDGNPSDLDQQRFYRLVLRP